MDLFLRAFVRMLPIIATRLGCFTFGVEVATGSESYTPVFFNPGIGILFLIDAMIIFFVQLFLKTLINFLADHSYLWLHSRRCHYQFLYRTTHKTGCMADHNEGIYCSEGNRSDIYLDKCTYIFIYAGNGTWLRDGFGAGADKLPVGSL